MQDNQKWCTIPKTDKKYQNNGVKQLKIDAKQVKNYVKKLKQPELDVL